MTSLLKRAWSKPFMEKLHCKNKRSLFSTLRITVQQISQMRRLNWSETECISSWSATVRLMQVNQLMYLRPSYWSNLGWIFTLKFGPNCWNLSFGLFKFHNLLLEFISAVKIAKLQNYSSNKQQRKLQFQQFFPFQLKSPKKNTNPLISLLFLSSFNGVLYNSALFTNAIFV